LASIDTIRIHQIASRRRGLGIVSTDSSLPNLRPIAFYAEKLHNAIYMSALGRRALNPRGVRAPKLQSECLGEDRMNDSRAQDKGDGLDPKSQMKTVFYINQQFTLSLHRQNDANFRPFVARRAPTTRP